MIDHFDRNTQMEIGLTADLQKHSDLLGVLEPTLTNASQTTSLAIWYTARVRLRDY